MSRSPTKKRTAVVWRYFEADDTEVGAPAKCNLSGCGAVVARPHSQTTAMRDHLKKEGKQDKGHSDAWDVVEKADNLEQVRIQQELREERFHLLLTNKLLAKNNGLLLNWFHENDIPVPEGLVEIPLAADPGIPNAELVQSTYTAGAVGHGGTVNVFGGSADTGGQIDMMAHHQLVPELTSAPPLHQPMTAVFQQQLQQPTSSPVKLPSIEGIFSPKKTGVAAAGHSRGICPFCMQSSYHQGKCNNPFCQNMPQN